MKHMFFFSFFLWYHYEKSKNRNLSKSQNQNACWLFDGCSIIFTWDREKQKHIHRIMSVPAICAHGPCSLDVLNSSTVTYVLDRPPLHGSIKVDKKENDLCSPNWIHISSKLLVLLWIQTFNRCAVFVLRFFCYYQFVSIRFGFVKHFSIFKWLKTATGKHIHWHLICKNTCANF